MTSTTVDSIMQSVHSATQSMGSSSSSKNEASSFESMLNENKTQTTPETTTESSANSGGEKVNSQENTQSQEGDKTSTASETTEGKTVITTVTTVDERQLELAAALLFQNQVASFRTQDVVTEQPVIVDTKVEETFTEETPMELENQMLNLGEQGQEMLQTAQDTEIPLELVPELAEEEVVVEELKQTETQQPILEKSEVEAEVVDVTVEVKAETDTEGEQEQPLTEQSDDVDVQKDTTTTTEKVVVEDDSEIVIEDEVDLQNPLFRKVEATPVKVAETVNTQEPDMEAQIAKKLIAAANAGDQSVTIQLTPENLGTITAQITRTAEGLLQIVLQASTSEATSLLSNHASNLAAALQGGGQTVTVEVQQPKESEQTDGQSDSSTDAEAKGENPHQHKQRKEEAVSDDFIQQMRLGLSNFMELDEV